MTIIDEVVKNFNLTNYYDVLRIPRDATKDEIKKAYLQRSLEWHPDKIEDPNNREISGKKFQILTQIYQILSDSKKRQDYDAQFCHSQKTGSSEDIESFARYDEIRLSDCNEQDGFFYYDCRCSGQFRLSRENLLSRTQSSNCQNVFIVDCDSCSNTIKIAL
uniref:DnaJ subfamily B member 8 n=1 Tax=Aceria tosichella TaxID=561515 RepID=A0A6G1SDI2_9ACAR